MNHHKTNSDDVSQDKTIVQESRAPILIKNTFVVGVGTTLSRIFGLAREILLSSAFGATWITDAFFIAFIIPNLLRRLFAEGALSTSVVPVFSQYAWKKDPKDARAFITAVFSGLLLTVSIICFIGIVISPWLVNLIAVGFRGDPEKMVTTIRFTQIMFPFLLLISLSALLMGVLNVRHVFSWPAIAPIFFNLGIIFFILLFQDSLGAFALAWGVLAGGIGQFAIQLVPFYQCGFRLHWMNQFWKNTGFRQVISLMLPMTLALAISQVNTLVDRIIALTLREGAVSALYFSVRLVELPQGIFGVAIATAILPQLSRHALQDNRREWEKVLFQGLRFILYTMLPLTVLLIVFRFESVALVYERGQFDRSATMMTTAALLYYTPGLVFFSLNQVLTKAFFSLKDTVTPVKISVFIVLLNIFLNVLLARYMDFPGLALATSLSASANSILLYLYLVKKHSSLSAGKDFLVWLGKVTLLTILVGAVSSLILFLSGKPLVGTFGSIMFVLSAVVVLGMYALLSRFLGVGEGETLFSLIMCRRKKTETSLSIDQEK
ncbi:MAG TPA: murein biosynthesis integral membrane protein MurJ [Atribacteraceae bacterium]|nr:murein biosynthesis integral membrane protein MurJ [Atribacteraceae bacterium]